MIDVAPADRADRQHHEHVGGAELAVDDGAVAETRSEPQIAFDERRQRVQGRLGSTASAASMSMAT